ncbi:MAG: PASTA domain-containing protein [Solirubrobacterales bacterium]
MGRPLLAVDENAEFNGILASFTPNGSPGPASQYHTTIEWGDGTTTTATVIGSAGTFTISGNHIYAEGGNWPLEVTVEDSGDSSKAEATGAATVADAPLSATGPTAVTLAEGGAAPATLAHFTDSDTGPVPPPSHYTATVSWGDGASSPATIIGLGGEQGYDVSTTPHVYAEEGSFTLTVTIEDIGGAHASVSIPVSVLDLPLTATPVSALSVSGLGNAPFTGRLASFTDADPAAQAGNYTAQILWGDGSGSDGTIAVASAGVFAVDGAHIYTQSGIYTVKVLMRDGGGQSALAQVSLTATVTPAVASPLPALPRCVVPNLKGRSLAAAGTALARARCKLGKVAKVAKPRRPKHSRSRPAGLLVIVGQSPAAGSSEPSNTAVSVRMAPAPAGKAKRHK